MSNKAMLWLAGAVLLIGIGFIALAWKPAIVPIETPAAASFSPEQVAQGKILAAASDAGAISGDLARACRPAVGRAEAPPGRC